MISYNKLKKNIFNLELAFMEISSLEYDLTRIRVNLEDLIFGNDKKDVALEIIADSIAKLKFISKQMDFDLKNAEGKIENIKNDFEV